MDDRQETPDNQTRRTISPLEGFLWLILWILIMVVVGILFQRYWGNTSPSIQRVPVVSFDEMIVSDGFHHIELANGQSWDLSYEANHERNFAGLVRHTSVINEPAFSILSHDILVTSQDFANPDLVDTSVSNHHFTWRSPTLENPQGSINLLHTVPMNEEIRQQLDAIENGDTVIITGWDIYRIDGYDSNGNSVGYWQDSGCNTTLVIAVEILSHGGE